MAKVIIPNKANHDYSAALEYGDSLQFLTVGYIPKYSVNAMVRTIIDGLKSSSPDDYIMLTSLTVLNVITAVVFALMHGRLNLLLYKNGRYVERKLVFDDLLQRETKEEKVNG